MYDCTCLCMYLYLSVCLQCSVVCVFIFMMRRERKRKKDVEENRSINSRRCFNSFIHKAFITKMKSKTSFHTFFLIVIYC